MSEPMLSNKARLAETILECRDHWPALIGPGRPSRFPLGLTRSLLLVLLELFWVLVWFCGSVGGGGAAGSLWIRLGSVDFDWSSSCTFRRVWFLGLILVDSSLFLSSLVLDVPSS